MCEFVYGLDYFSFWEEFRCFGIVNAQRNRQAVKQFDRCSSVIVAESHFSFSSSFSYHFSKAPRRIVNRLQFVPYPCLHSSPMLISFVAGRTKSLKTS